MDKKEIDALISLLDDPDEGIFEHIKDKLLSLGGDVIPMLEDAWEHSFDTLIQSRIENIIHKIQFETIFLLLKKWVLENNQALLEGVLLVAKYQYPDLNEAKIKKQLNLLKQDIWLELNENLTALEKVKVINHIIFDVHGFSGNTTNFHAPQNSYLNNVLESKKGNPLSLSILYIIIAQNLEIPIYGVNLPEHFILAYRDENKQLPILAKDKNNKVFFYINAFSKGSVFSRKEVDAFLKQLKLPQNPIYYDPCSNVEIIKRLIRNLIQSYEKLGYPNESSELKILLEALN